MAAVYSIRKRLARLAAAGLAQLSLAGPSAAADAPAPTTTEAIVQFHTVCSNCHEAQCSGRLSFDSGSVGFDASADTTYFLHLKTGAALLRRISFR
ncbi:MAG: hypothetical protein A2040_09205 [Rhodocyclales bacterium GWA2_65_19]|nr:MAG: hypothetical protein A2040_09205 [Rhodocyclales bacterium GWA2_65_19]